jgi:hypothetical protein
MNDDDELNAKIEALCKARGWTFSPHECPPWEADEGPSPWGADTAGSESWPKAQALRRKLIAEIEEQSKQLTNGRTN